MEIKRKFNENMCVKCMQLNICVVNDYIIIK